MNLIDTHCHLDFLTDIDEVILRAEKNNVRQFIIPSVNIDSADKILAISQKYPQVFSGIGIHPTDINTENNRNTLDIVQLNKLEKILQKKSSKIVAIGECGLDFKDEITQSQKNIQIEIFKKHLEWAVKYKLPLIIHNRKANEEILVLLDNCLKSHKIQGVFHCFSGSKKFVKQVINLGFYFGIGGLITFDTGLQEVTKEIPLEKIILETDSPYLTPKPIKDTKPWPNEPKNLVYIAEKLAQIKQESLENIIKITTQNAEDLFSLPKINN